MLNLKKFAPLEEVYEGLPPEFSEYLKFCKTLNFQRDPNFNHLRSKFTNIYQKEI